MYKVSIKKSALKELATIPQNIREIIKEEIYNLRKVPFPQGCKS